MYWTDLTLLSKLSLGRSLVFVLYSELRSIPADHYGHFFNTSITVKQVPGRVMSSVLCMLYVMCCNRVIRWAAWDGVTTSYQRTKCNEKYDYFCGSRSHVHVDVSPTQSGVSNACMFCPPLLYTRYFRMFGCVRYTILYRLLFRESSLHSSTSMQQETSVLGFSFRGLNG